MSESEQIPTGEYEYLTDFHDRVKPGPELFEVRQAMATEAAETLKKYLDYLPEDILRQIAYEITAKAMEVESRKISSSYPVYADEYPEEASLNKVILQNSLNARG